MGTKIYRKLNKNETTTFLSLEHISVNRGSMLQIKIAVELQGPHLTLFLLHSLLLERASQLQPKIEKKTGQTLKDFPFRQPAAASVKSSSVLRCEKQEQHSQEACRHCTTPANHS